MVQHTLRVALVLVASGAAACLALDGSTCSAIERQPPTPAYDLFYNYYVPAGPGGGVPAQMYLCPRPTPAYVGHTWITYQPLMPHEFLYRHHRKYTHINRGDASVNITRVCWW